MPKLEPAGPYRCGHCGLGFGITESGLTCAGCGTPIPISNGIHRFPLPDDGTTPGVDPFDPVTPIYETPM